MYVCPRCKGTLDSFACRSCNVEYEVFGEVPYFLTPKGTGAKSAVGAVYDAIYTEHSNVWEDQGREEGFRKYFSALVGALAPGRLLEVGCGEGLLLAAMSSDERFGVDPSIQALQRARQLSGAQCAAAQAEFLPFADGYFAAVTSVGVMEHFSDPDLATREIFRVLKKGGAYVALIHTDMGLADRLQLKLREYFFPKFRPVAFARWAWKKIHKPIRQPMRRSYTIASAQDCLKRAGFLVIQTITRLSSPEAPLAGKHVVLLVARKAA